MRLAEAAAASCCRLMRARSLSVSEASAPSSFGEAVGSRGGELGLEGMEEEKGAAEKGARGRSAEAGKELVRLTCK